MSEKGASQTINVYDDGKLLHFPDPVEDKTICGLDATDMNGFARPVTWAGVWCHECTTKALAYGTQV